MTLRIIADEDREPSPYFADAVALARGAAEQVTRKPIGRLHVRASCPRELYVVEAIVDDGTAFPLNGDAYLDERGALERQAECEFETRVTRYVPEVKR